MHTWKFDLSKESGDSASNTAIKFDTGGLETGYDLRNVTVETTRGVREKFNLKQGNIKKVLRYGYSLDLESGQIYSVKIPSAYKDGASYKTKIVGGQENVLNDLINEQTVIHVLPDGLEVWPKTSMKVEVFDEAKKKG